MKNMFAALVLTLVSVAAFAAPKTVLKYSVHVGFAPPQFQGVHGVVLDSSGVLTSFDNKGNKTVVLKLSKSSTSAVLKKIEAVKAGPLTGPNGPICMDAPSSEIAVTDSKGTTIPVWREANCNEQELAGAGDLVELGKNLYSLDLAL